MHLPKKGKESFLMKSKKRNRAEATRKTIKLGVHRALVVSNWEIAKECLSINDKVFATRPKVAGMEILGYNNAMIGSAPYGPYWSQVRKFATVELHSNHWLDMLMWGNLR